MSRSGTGTSAAALRAAASAGNFEACQHYLKSFRCVHFPPNSEGRTALHLAASGGHRAIIRLLLAVAAPKEVNCTDNSGYTSLQIAASQGQEEIITLLLANEADINSSDKVNGNSALHEAAWKGYSRAVRLLAKGGANLNKCNFESFTPLHLCCQNGHNQTCRELLMAGAIPDIQNNYGDTPLHTAARYGHAGVTRILISAQCRVSHQNKNGDTALHIAAAMGRRKLTKILLEAGCDKHVHNKQNETPKDIALRKNLNEILSIFHHYKEKKNHGIKKSKAKKYKNKFNIERKYTGNICLVEKKDWSPYGCHYYPSSELFPCPRLDSLPNEPLKRGEQYYMDLAGNICKGPVGVGHSCYCAPFFRHLRIRMERDKREFQRAQIKLDQRMTNLEQLLKQNLQIITSERTQKTNRRKSSFLRCRSLEILGKMKKPLIQTARSMDQLHETEHFESNSKLNLSDEDNNSESSDETRYKRRVGDNEHFTFPSLSNYNLFSTNVLPRYRGAVYSPYISDTLHENPEYLEDTLKSKDCKSVTNSCFTNSDFKRDDHIFQPEMKYIEYPHLQNYECTNSTKYYEQNLNSKLKENERKIKEKQKFDLSYVTTHLQDCTDRDTNIDSGYSTKVYGSSKGNSPNLVGQIDNECLGASSIV